ncbi:hypothetical protein [Elioraea sp.]|uniref:hypothetical protein n=1 Tax=Elioraea sp. TaxID=2185103 RepID=UPI0025C63B29|nr:hypothetical protein [Elioraea sp.]
MALTRVNGQKYDQGQYFQEGVCFRLSFKWAAVSMFGGDFNYAMDKGGLSIASTKKKFGEYIDFSEKHLADATKNWSDSKVFGDWVAGDVLQAMAYINKWGVKVTDSTHAYGGVTLDKIVDGTASDYMKAANAAGITVVYGYYGYDKGVPAGHATAYSNGRYFDPNYGTYTSSETTAAGIGRDIDAFIADKERTWTQKRFIIYLLGAANPTVKKRA